MAYSTQTDLLNQLTEAELIQLTDDSSAGTVDAAKVTAAIARADGVIDAYAGGRATLPLLVSEQVKQLSVDLAIYFLEQRRRRVRDQTEKTYERGIAFLRDVAVGKAALDQPTKTQATELDVKTPDRDPASGEPLRFGKENLEDY